MSLEQDIKKHLNESDHYAQMDRYSEQAALHRMHASHHSSKLGMFNQDDETGRVVHNYHSKKSQLHSQIAAALEDLHRHMEQH